MVIMRALLALLLLSQLAAGDFLEIRKVVEAGKGAKTYDEPGKAGEKLTVSDELIVGDRHLEEVFPGQFGTSRTNGGAPEPIFGTAIKLNAEGEERMIAATKDGKQGVLRLAVIVDGKLKSAPTVMSIPLGANFQINADSMEEAKELTGKLLAAKLQAKAASFEIRRVVEAGQGTLKVKAPKTGEELTLSDEVILNRKDLAKFTRDAEETTHKITLELTEAGGKRLKEATTDAEPGKLRLAVLVEGEAISAPVLQSGPLGKRIVVTIGEGEEGKALAGKIEKSLETGK